MTSREYVSSSSDYPAQQQQKTSPKPGYKVSVQRLNSWFFNKQALKSINLDVKENTATALIGPSGCG
ncbi:MAG: phosphate ABC transporter ATP-binding protein, partial [Nitrososphaera sp.]